VHTRALKRFRKIAARDYQLETDVGTVDIHLRRFLFVSGGPAFSGGRRKSVFAETYDPEEDEHDEKAVSPQTTFIPYHPP